MGSFAGCAGQRCMAASVLLLIGDNIDLLNAVLKKAFEIKPGQNQGQMGPLIDSISFHKVTNYIKQAEEGGSQILLDGRTWSSKINWIGPTILLHSDPKAPAMTDEIFGPVLSVYTCSSWDEAIQI